MARQRRGPWLHTRSQNWKACIDGKHVNLGKDEVVARQRWIALQEMSPEQRRATVRLKARGYKAHLADSRKAGKVIERAATMHVAARWGLTLNYGSPRPRMVELLRSLPESEQRAAALAQWERFTFLPDGWELRVGEGRFELWVVEIEYTAPMGITKILAYSQLAKDLPAVGGVFRLLVSDRYGTATGIDVIALGDRIEQAAQSLGREHWLPGWKMD